MFKWAITYEFQIMISTCILEIQYILKLSILFLPTEAALTAVHQILHKLTFESAMLC